MIRWYISEIAECTLTNEQLDAAITEGSRPYTVVTFQVMDVFDTTAALEPSAEHIEFHMWRSTFEDLGSPRFVLERQETDGSTKPIRRIDPVILDGESTNIPINMLPVPVDPRDDEYWYTELIQSEERDELLSGPDYLFEGMYEDWDDRADDADEAVPSCEDIDDTDIEKIKLPCGHVDFPDEPCTRCEDARARKIDALEDELYAADDSRSARQLAGRYRGYQN